MEPIFKEVIWPKFGYLLLRKFSLALPFSWWFGFLVLHIVANMILNRCLGAEENWALILCLLGSNVVQNWMDLQLISGY